MTPSASQFKPPSNIGTLCGGLISAFCGLVGAALIYRGLTLSPGLDQLWPLLVGSMFLALSALFGYWTWGRSSLTYVVDRNALSIRWGGVRQVIPLASIRGLLPASSATEPLRLEGVNWVGHHVGHAEIEAVGPVIFYSGHKDLIEVLFVQTERDTYGISVADAQGFATAVQDNQARSPLFEERQAVHRQGIAAQSFWLDTQALILALLVVVGFFLVLGYVLDAHAGLGETVRLRFPSLGRIERVADRSELLDIARSAAVFLGLNLILAIVLHRWERMVSYVLLLAGFAIQIALLIAATVAVA